MNIGYIHLDYGEWTTRSYNIQEIGLAKALEQMGHQTTIVYWMSPKDRRCGTEVNTTSILRKCICPIKESLYITYGLIFITTNTWHRCVSLAKRQLALPEAVSFCLKHNLKYYCYVGTVHSSSPKAISRWIMDKLSSRNFSAFKKDKSLL